MLRSFLDLHTHDMKIALIGLVTVVALVVLVAIVGWSLPVRHRAARQATYTTPAAAVYAVIASPRDFPAWRSKVKSIEMMPPQGGNASYREIGGDGNILYTVDETVPPHRLVTRIADKSLPFGGTWTYELSPAAAGTTLRITEDGEVYNPIFRVMSKYVFGHDATIDTYLHDLGKRFGQEVTVTSVASH
jgi:hypothetical protein